MLGLVSTREWGDKVSGVSLYAGKKCEGSAVVRDEECKKSTSNTECPIGTNELLRTRQAFMARFQLNPA